MADQAFVATAEPAEETVERRKATGGTKRKRQPRYHVILWDDQSHSYEYVIGMLQSIFGHPVTHGFKLAQEVDMRGRAIVLTTTREHAELKRDQIHAFGKDSEIDDCKGSMSATIEPEVG